MPHESLSAAYVTGLRDLLECGHNAPAVTDPRSPASCFGESERPSRELVGYKAEVLFPSSSILFSDALPVDICFLVGQLVWFLRGSDSLEILQYYNSAASRFSHDSRRLCGSFGWRLFNYRDEIDQITNISALLTRDRGSRRAIALILSPLDNAEMTKEFPCAIGLQVFVRDDKLDMVVYMRAQQALTLFPYDTALFATLQQVLCNLMGLACGRYVHFCGTYHFYTRESELVKEVLRAGVSEIPLGVIDDYEAGWAQLKQMEEELRRAAVDGDSQRILCAEKTSIEGGTFFRNIFDVLRFAARSRVHERFAEEVLATTDSAIVRALRAVERRPTRSAPYD